MFHSTYGIDWPRWNEHIKNHVAMLWGQLSANKLYGKIQNFKNSNFPPSYSQTLSFYCMVAAKFHTTVGPGALLSWRRSKRTLFTQDAWLHLYSSDMHCGRMCNIRYRTDFHRTVCSTTAAASTTPFKLSRDGLTYIFPAALASRWMASSVNMTSPGEQVTIAGPNATRISREDSY